MKRGITTPAANLILAALCLALSACAASTPPPAPVPTVLYPAPPADPRIQFLTAITSERDVAEEDSPSFFERLVGAKPEDEAEQVILKPYGVAIHGGVIYVCDTALRGIDVIDLERRSFEQWQPTGLGQLQKPINCHTDQEDGRLYVADVDRGQVVVFDAERNYVTAIGSGPGERPVDVFAAHGKVWVADLEAQQVRVYAKPDFQLVASIPGAQADSADRLYGPTNIWVTDDRLYVSSFGAWQVKVYTLEGTLERTVSSYGTGIGQLARPKGIAVDRESILYVVDAAFENVQMFDPEGQILMFFGGSYAGPGDMWLPAKVIVDYENLDYFRQFVDPSFELQYLIIVTNQYGPDKLTIYGRIRPKESSGDQ